MATELAKAYVQIVPSASGIKGKLTEELGGASNSAGRSSGSKFASVFKKAIAAAGIGAVLKQALTEGASLEQSLGGIETLFKDSADKMKSYANEAYKTAGLSANAYMEISTSFAASLLSSLGGNTEKAADAANQAIIDMADNSNKMGTAMEAIQNAYQGFAKQNYTMLDNLKLGYGGTKAEMERLLADAQKITGVKYDISNLSDVYSAIHVIQTELGITGTTALEASTTLAGSFASVKASFSNLLGNLALGNDIKPSLNALAETIKIFVGDNLLPAIKNILVSLPSAFVEMVPVIAPELLSAAVSLFLSIVEALPQVITAFKEAWPAIVEAVKFELSNAWPEIKAAAELTFSAITEAIAPVIDQVNEKLQLAHEWLQKHSDVLTVAAIAVGTLTAAIVAYNVAQAIKNAGGIVELAQLAATAIGVGALTVAETAHTVATTIATAATTAFGAAMAFLTSPITLVILAIGALIAIIVVVVKNWDDIKAAAGKAWDYIKNVWGKVSSWFKSNVVDPIANFGKNMLSVGKNLVEGLWNGISGSYTWIKNKIKSWVGNVLTFIKSLFGIHSPSTEMAWVGKMNVLGLAQGMEDNTGAVKSAIDDITRMTTGSLESNLAVNAALGVSTDAAATDKLDRLIAIVAALGDRLDNIDVLLDSDKLVGALIAKIDKRLGERQYRAQRGTA